MQAIEVHGRNRKSTVMVGEKLLNLKRYLPETRTIVISDPNVIHYYQPEFPPADVISIGIGEDIKNLKTVENIYAELLRLDADRSSFIVGIGGGIVCDVAGFVASTYLRGVRFAFAATTLLSQVDASVGGKNGVNFHGFKNMVGTFNQPEFVLCDINLLRTLPEKELLCGFAEIVKHAALGDAKLFPYLEENAERALALDEEVIEKLVYDSVSLKASVVNQDELEKGERRKLNFGHTVGHVIEKIQRLPHGEAVSIGMVAAAKLSVSKNLLSESSAVRLENLLRRMKLPTRAVVPAEEILGALKKDKKRAGDKINFVLLRGIGDAVVEAISVVELERELKEFL